MVRISNFDILRLLRENARASFTSLARTLGVTETAVRKRVRKLEDEGIIQQYTIDIDPKKIGFGVKALIGVDTEPECYVATIEHLKNIPETLSLYTSSGDHMLLIEAWFVNSQALTLFTRELEELQGVTKICPAILMEKIK